MKEVVVQSSYTTTSKNSELGSHVNLNRIEFSQNKAHFGAAVCIYSPSSKSGIKIAECRFISNQLLEQEENGKIKGGSAIYLTVNKAEIVACKFKSNIGFGGSVKLSENSSLKHRE